MNELYSNIRGIPTRKPIKEPASEQHDEAMDDVDQEMDDAQTPPSKKRKKANTREKEYLVFEVHVKQGCDDKYAESASR